MSQRLAGKTLRFQRQWCQDVSWLHFIPGVEEAFLRKTSQFAKNRENTLISTGLKNCKKVCDRFALHAQLDCQKMTLITQLYETRSVNVHLSNVWASQQEGARACLLKIVGAVQLLARQGLALRGYDNSEGNFAQLLKYKSVDDPDLKKILELPT